MTVTEDMFREAFKAIRPNNFSHTGLSLLWDDVTECEDGSGEETELDVIAFCCDWSEYPNALEAAQEYGADLDEDDSHKEALSWLRDRTSVRTYEEGGSGTIIMQVF